MQMIITFIAVVGGLIFSLAIALLAEELIFGQVFRLFFSSVGLVPAKVAQETLAVKAAQKR
jgi:ABC-type enterobactin transport system permease subunit